MKKNEIINREFETRMMHCGLMAEIIAYRSCNDMDVRFETGHIRHGVRYSDFKKEKLAEFSNEEKRAMRLGEIRTMHCGMDAEITDYPRSTNISVEFENSAKRTRVAYDSFKKGSVSPRPRTRVGEKKMMNCGVMAEIIAYRGNKDIDVRFEGKTIREHMTYDAFKRGSIAVNKPEKSKRRMKDEQKYVGQKKMMKCGLEGEIVAFRGYANIEVKLSNDEICSTDLRSFNAGTVSPTRVYLGEIRTMRCGQEARIVSFRTNDDIDIEFVDTGFVRKKVTYSAFSAGQIKAPVLDHRNRPFNSMAEMCEHYHIKYQTYHRRIMDGWTQREALTIPVCC